VTQLTLYHVSEEAGIEQFEPRAAVVRREHVEQVEQVEPVEPVEPVVWAIDAARLRNYLLPRDCPRVTYYAGSNTTNADAERFLGGSTAVIAIEYGWLARVQSCRLYCYRLPVETFRCIDECAGYFVSRVPVVPTSMDVIDDPIGALARHGVELRILPTLWPLRDAVVASSLQFSIIRMRNAQPRNSNLHGG
jgi:hypothetical protein